jgi:hypothetical protein
MIRNLASKTEDGSPPARKKRRGGNRKRRGPGAEAPSGE